MKKNEAKWKREGLEIRGAGGELIAIMQTYGCYERAVRNGDYIVKLVNRANGWSENKLEKGKKT